VNFDLCIDKIRYIAVSSRHCTTVDVSRNTCRPTTLTDVHNYYI